jgi:hypothetical protein
MRVITKKVIHKTPTLLVRKIRINLTQVARGVVYINIPYKFKSIQIICIKKQPTPLMRNKLNSINYAN